jgi:hypothetical protein
MALEDIAIVLPEFLLEPAQRSGIPEGLKAGPHPADPVPQHPDMQAEDAILLEDKIKFPESRLPTSLLEKVLLEGLEEGQGDWLEQPVLEGDSGAGVPGQQSHAKSIQCCCQSRIRWSEPATASRSPACFMARAVTSCILRVASTETALLRRSRTRTSPCSPPVKIVPPAGWNSRQLIDCGEGCEKTGSFARRS